MVSLLLIDKLKIDELLHDKEELVVILVKERPRNKERSESSPPTSNGWTDPGQK